MSGKRLIKIEKNPKFETRSIPGFYGKVKIESDERFSRNETRKV